MSRLSDFQVLRQVGKGSYGSVYKVERRSDKRVYALKKVKLRNMTQKEKYVSTKKKSKEARVHTGLKAITRENSFNEIRCLASMRHRNILAYYDAFLDGEDTLCIITEFITGGDLESRIKKHAAAKTNFKENEIWNIFIQICDGIKALHSWNIIHRDLKCANVFLDEDGTIRLGDFGVSKVLSSKEKWAKTQIGTPYYVSPEMWKNRPYDMKSDIWSLGCVLYEMAALHPPFRASDVNSLARKAMGGMYPQIPYKYSSDLAALIKKLLSTNPSSRPTIEEILAMPIVQKQRERIALEHTRGESRRTEMLATIIVPKDNKLTRKIELPGPRYDEEMESPVTSSHAPELPTLSQGRANYSGSDANRLPKINEVGATPQRVPGASVGPSPRSNMQHGLPPQSISSQYGSFYKAGYPGAANGVGDGHRRAAQLPNVGMTPISEAGRRSTSEPTGYVSNRAGIAPYGYPSKGSAYDRQRMYSRMHHFKIGGI